MCEQYNGWTNRETWAMALWLSNEYATVTALEEMAGRATNEYGLAAAIKAYFDDLEEVAPDHHRTIRDDVGSIYRVDWHSIAEHYWDDFGPDGDVYACEMCGADTSGVLCAECEDIEG